MRVVQPKPAATRNYVIGYVLSIALTLAAYVVVKQHSLTHIAILLSIGCLAIVQFLVQLVYFLHIDAERSPRLRLLALLFMALIVLILVFGSIWIMNNLNYNMTQAPASTDSII